MVNPPTRPYSEEELKEITILLSSKNNGDSPASSVPTPSIKPIEIKAKTLIAFENTQPVVFENNVLEASKSIAADIPVINAGKTVSSEGAHGITAETKTFFSQYGVWIIVGSIVVLVGAYIYWDYQKKKKENEHPKL